jgi:hypothetical protein
MILLLHDTMHYIVIVSYSSIICMTLLYDAMQYDEPYVTLIVSLLIN